MLQIITIQYLVKLTQLSAKFASVKSQLIQESQQFETQHLPVRKWKPIMKRMISTMTFQLIVELQSLEFQIMLSWQTQYSALSLHLPFT